MSTVGKGHKVTLWLTPENAEALSTVKTRVAEAEISDCTYSRIINSLIADALSNGIDALVNRFKYQNSRPQQSSANGSPGEAPPNHREMKPLRTAIGRPGRWWCARGA